MSELSLTDEMNAWNEGAKDSANFRIPTFVFAKVATLEAERNHWRYYLTQLYEAAGHDPTDTHGGDMALVLGREYRVTKARCERLEGVTEAAKLAYEYRHSNEGAKVAYLMALWKAVEEELINE